MPETSVRPSTATPPGQRTSPEIESSRRRFVRRARARRWRLWRRLLVGLLVVGVVCTLGWLVFFSSYLSVKGAEVRGTHVLSDAAVEEAAAVPQGGPLATVDLGAIKARVEDLAAVRSADVSRAWPNHVRIDVTERTAVAVVSWEGTWRGLDTDGVLFRTYPNRPTGLPEVRVTSSTPADALVETGAVIGALPPALMQRVDYLDVRSIDAISLHLHGGAVVNWGSSDQSAEKAAVLQVLLRNPARVYDVTAPGRPTVRR